MEKLWLKHYQQGVPYEINVDEYASLVDLFDQSCQKYEHHIAYVNMKSEISFTKLEELSRHFAIYLQQLGLQKGARVAIMMPNLLQYPIALFAILRAGFVVVNTNPLYTHDEVRHQVNDAGAEVIIVLSHFAHTVEKALPSMPGVKHVIVTQIGDAFPTMKRLIVNAVVQYIKKNGACLSYSTSSKLLSSTQTRTTRNVFASHIKP